MRPRPEITPLNPQAFLERLLALLPTGTALTVGIQHGNGTFTAKHYVGGAVDPRVTHVSTGLHKANADGSVSARKDTCEATWCLVLDDVGNPEKVTRAPDMEPTLKLETSPGNEQWAYVYDRHVTPAEGAQIANGADDAGLSDGFIRNRGHHWWRVPGSLPEPKRRQGRTTPARWTGWTGEVFDPEGLCADLGITKDAKANYRPDSALYDPRGADADPLWRWMSENGWTSSDFLHPSGWNDVRCPNHEAHTDGRPWGRFMPANRRNPHGGFICHHAHCNGKHGKALTIRDLQERAAKEGGPSRDVLAAHAREIEREISESATAEFNMLLRKLRDEVNPGFRDEALRVADAADDDEEADFDPDSATALMRADLPEPDPIIDGLLMRGQLGILFARQKAGKSYMLLDVIEAVATGGEFLGRKAQSGGVLYYALEDGPRRLRQRLLKRKVSRGVTDRLFLKMDHEMPEDTSYEARLKMLVQDLIRLKDKISVVLIDTRAYFEGDTSKMTGRDMNAYQRDVVILKQLRQIAQVANTAVILTTHEKKGRAGSADFMDHMSGSLGQSATADVLWQIDRPEGSNTAMFKANGRDTDGFIEEAIEHQPDTRWTKAQIAVEVMRAVTGTRTVKGKQSCAAFILSVLKTDEWTSRGDLRAMAVGFTDPQFKMALSRLRRSGAIVETDSGLRLKGGEG